MLPNRLITKKSVVTNRLRSGVGGGDGCGVAKPAETTACFFRRVTPCGFCVRRAEHRVLQEQGHSLQRSGGHHGVRRPLSAVELRSAL